MIKEFRIGNLFLDSLNRVFEVEGLKGEYVYFSLSNGTKMKYNICSLKQIPLTEEWKGKINNDKNILIDAVGFVIFKNGYAYQIVFEDYPFVHQFQNLYFALCGEELQLQ